MNCPIDISSGPTGMRHRRAVWMRPVAATLVAVLMTGVVQAGQSGSPAGGQRVRVTGLRQYELPGVLTLDGDAVSASQGVTIGPTTIQVPAPPDGPLTVLRPGTRLVGHATSVTDGILVLRVDGVSQSIRVPLDSLAVIERGRAGRRHLLRGILVGIGAFYAGVVLVFAACGLGCDDFTAALGTFGTGIAAGLWAGRSSPEVWTPVSTSDFVSQFGK